MLIEKRRTSKGRPRRMCLTMLTHVKECLGMDSYDEYKELTMD